MARIFPALCIVALFFVIAISLSVDQVDALDFNHYKKSCPQAESIIFREVQRYFKKDPTIAPGLLRLIFHDCFVRGCDASVLLSGRGAERASPINARLHGFQVIDAAKHHLEKACPRTVSCADILAFASRDAVVLTGGKGWRVIAGRRDGRISNKIEPEQQIPTAFASVNELVSTFAQQGLNTEDMVVLSGAHTIGITHCNHISDRIFTPVDKTMPKDLLKSLQKSCPKASSSTALVMDRKSVHKFDTEYFKNIKAGYGLMTSDQGLYREDFTRTIVDAHLQQNTFVNRFAEAMFKLQFIQPLEAPDGEIRRRCQCKN